MSEDFKLCRLCLSPHGSISIFSASAAAPTLHCNDSGEAQQYSELITRCTHLPISEDDGLPGAMCSTCEAELSVSYRFLVKCLESDAVLRKLNLTESDPANNDVNIKMEEDQFIEYDMKEEYLQSEGEFSDIAAVPEPVKKKKRGRKRKDVGDKVKTDSLDLENVVCSEPKEKRKRGRPRKNPDQLVRYIRKEKQEKKLNPIPCPTCGLITYTPSAMIIHMRVHSDEKPFACNQCSSAFKAKGTLKRHIETNHTVVRERKFTCETCGKSFYRKRDILFHMRGHTGEKPHACNICSKRFAQIGTLIRHKRSHTGEKPYSCDICSKKFADKSMVTKHMSVHSDERNYSCHLCEKKMKTKSALQNHVILHSNEKSFICSFCGLAFTFKGNLKMHTMRVHSERSGQCGICNMTFSNVAEHMNKHTGNLAYKCTMCSRAFISKRSLVNHCSYRHEGQNKYKCPEKDCKKTFSKPFMVQFHLLKYHINETPFVCKLCSRGFFRVSDLNRHLHVSHNQLAEKKIVPESVKQPCVKDTITVKNSVKFF